MQRSPESERQSHALSTLRTCPFLAATCFAMGIAGCNHGGPGAQTPAESTPSATSAPSRPMVPASGIDTGRSAPAAAEPEALSETADAEAESAATGEAGTDVSADPSADEQTEQTQQTDPNGDENTQEVAPSVPPRSPLAALLAPKVSFMINYQSSGARELAVQECEKKAEGDLQKRAECLSERREDFKADVLVFKPLKNDRYNLTIYRRVGSTLKEVFGSIVQLKDESEQAVSMRFLGGQRGRRPMFGGKATVRLILESDSSLKIEDPKFGMLPYSAKIGLVQDQ